MQAYSTNSLCSTFSTLIPEAEDQIVKTQDFFSAAACEDLRLVLLQVFLQLLTLLTAITLVINQMNY